MRKILRAWGKGLRIFLWGVKGLLVVMAVGVLVLWPMSWGTYRFAGCNGYTARSHRVDFLAVFAGCFDGRILMSYDSRHFLGGEWLKVGRDSAAREGAGRTWRMESVTTSEDLEESLEVWGPFAWKFEPQDHPGFASELVEFSAPCWLIASALALWPLTNFALLMRRRRRRWRRELVGCCLRCGYDLRTTAEKGGPLFERCPECGADSAGVSPLGKIDLPPGL